MVASIGFPLQGRLAAQEMTGQSNLAGEAGTAFAMAVGEAGTAYAHAVGEAELLDGIECTMGGLAEGELKGQEKEQPDDALSPSNITALLMMGAYHMHQAADVDVPIEKVPVGEAKAAPFGNDPISQESLPGGGLKGSIAPGNISKSVLMPKRDDASGLATTSRDKAALPQTMAAEAGIPIPVLAHTAAKGMDELDQADFKDIRKLQEQGTAKAAQPVGIDSAREAVMPIKGMTGESVKAILEPEENSQKANGDKAKPVQAPVSALFMTHAAAKALRAESMQAAPDMAPENTVREENVAMQVARASIRALGRGATEYRIRLSPEGLGEVEVTVVAKGKAVSLSMRTDNEAARGLILGHADELRAELGQQSYQVEGLSVEVGMNSGNGAGFFAHRDHADPAHGQRRTMMDQEPSTAQAAQGPQMKRRQPMPRSGTINYRV